MTRPSSKPSPADAPLVHQRLGVLVGFLGRDPVVDDLAVDHDLGAGSRLDRVDRRLSFGDRCRREDAGLVVDGTVDLRIGERRPGFGARLDRPGSRSAVEAVHDLDEPTEGRGSWIAAREARAHPVGDDSVRFDLRAGQRLRRSRLPPRRRSRRVRRRPRARWPARGPSPRRPRRAIDARLSGCRLGVQIEGPGHNDDVDLVD